MTALRLSSAAVLAAAAMLLSACTSPEGPSPAPDIEVTVTGPPAPSAPAGDGGSTATYETAIVALTTAEAEAGGRALAIDRDDDGSWEVHVAADDREVEVRIDAGGTGVLSARDDDALDDDDRAGLDAAATSLADAVRIAETENRTGSAFDEASLDRDDDLWAWEVSFTDGREVRVAVADGRIVTVGG